MWYKLFQIGIAEIAKSYILHDAPHVLSQTSFSLLFYVTMLVLFKNFHLIDQVSIV